jgi:hypothetical protein
LNQAPGLVASINLKLRQGKAPNCHLRLAATHKETNILFGNEQERAIIAYRRPSFCELTTTERSLDSSRLRQELVMSETTNQDYHATRALNSRRMAKTAASAPIAAIHAKLAEHHEDLAHAGSQEEENGPNKSI